jgi:type IX secretion system PorP/SprF family membrane protein
MRIRCILYLLLFVNLAVAQQQSLYTNITMHQYLYNPAYAGANEGLELNAGYRNQWAGFDGAPKTVVASGYGTFKKKPQMASGLLVMSDKSGLLQRTAFYGSYSYHVKLGKKAHLGLGISAGGVQYNVKIYNANPYDSDDEFLKNNILNANAFDANAGIYLHSKKFFLGFSSLQLMNGKIYWPNSAGKLSPHYYVNTGYNILLDKKKKEWVLQPSALARFNGPAPFQMEGTLKGLYKDMIWLGGTYRLQGIDFSGASACAMIGATLHKQYTFGYSYDYALSTLQQYSSGSHEIILRYTMAPKKKKENEKEKSADEEEFNNIDNSMKTNLKNKKNEEDKK